MSPFPHIPSVCRLSVCLSLLSLSLSSLSFSLSLLSLSLSSLLFSLTAKASVSEQKESFVLQQLARRLQARSEHAAGLELIEQDVKKRAEMDGVNK